jgi:hypothetical protein
MNEEEDFGEPQPEEPEGQRQKFIPIEALKEKPVSSDTELAKDLMKVVGKTAAKKVVVPVLDEKTGKLLGYDVKEAKNVFYEIISEDMTKANLGDGDMRIVREVGLVSNYTQAISEAHDVDLSPTQKLLADAVLLFLTSSRAKSGWNAWLSKTDKTISQTSVEQLSKQLEQEKKSKWKFW